MKGKILIEMDGLHASITVNDGVPISAAPFGQSPVYIEETVGVGSCRLVLPIVGMVVDLIRGQCDVRTIERLPADKMAESLTDLLASALQRAFPAVPSVTVMRAEGEIARGDMVKVTKERCYVCDRCKESA